jgi:hypothetical protein
VSLNDCSYKKNLNFLIMKNQILNLGKALNKAEQKSINGGRMALMCKDVCQSNSDCGSGNECFTGPCAGEDTKMCREAA